MNKSVKKMNPPCGKPQGIKRLSRLLIPLQAAEHSLVLPSLGQNGNEFPFRSLLAKIKTELFFIYKLLNPKYTPTCRFNFRCYFNYFKNRFFSEYLVAGVARMDYELKDDLEVHVLVQKDDLWPLIWTLRSFLFQSGLLPKIIIHDDGSLNAKSRDILTSGFSNLEIITRAEADKLVTSKIKDELTLSFRERGHPLILKFLDILFLSKAGNVMILDSDILFFNKPLEIVDFVRKPTGYDALISGIPNTYKGFELAVKKDYLQKTGIKENGAEFMNSGIIIYKKAVLSEEMIYEYLKNCLLDKSHYFVEMTGWNSLIAQTKYELLSVDKYIIKGRISEATIAKHFTSGRRQEMFAYGIDLVKSKIKNEKIK